MTGMVIDAALWLCVAMLAVSFVLGLLQIRTARDEATRAAVGDLVFFIALAMILLLSIYKESWVTLDAALLASILGILATIALARILTRGRR